MSGILSSRVIVICVALTTIVTLYSLSELHRISAQHAAKDDEIHFATTTHGTHVESSSSSSKATATKTQEPRKLGGTAGSQGTAVTTTLAAAKTSSKKAYLYEHTELWGDVVKWGTSNKATSAEDCCNQCKAYLAPHPDTDPDCNVCVYCGDKEKCNHQFGECWLKHLAHPEASKPSKQGPDVPWTAGTIDVDMNANPDKATTQVKSASVEPRKYHIVTSAQGSAVHWQIRIHYYWYKKQKAKCEKEGPCDMGGWTRLLHSGQADDLMDELPTMVVDPLPADMVEHGWYVVLNRPYAFVQWVQKAKIPERYVLMAEPDHIMIRPIPNFMNGDVPAAFPFFYIEPSKPEFSHITQKFTGPATKKQLEEIAPIGNSPTFMTFEDMKRVMPVWMNVSIAVFKDPEASKAWGWVQEMYGFCIALWKCDIKKVDLFLHLMAQPPWDTNLEMAPKKPFYIIHYTYGMDYKLTGEFTPGKFGEWRFDKRSFSGRPMPRHIGDPPKNMKNDLVRTLVNSFNEATAAIPCWDKYAETGKVSKTCDEKPGGFLAEELAAKEGKSSS